MNTVLTRYIPCENYIGGLFLSEFLTGVATDLACGIMLWARSFTSLPGGNMVDGLPPVFNTDAGGSLFGGEKIRT